MVLAVFVSGCWVADRLVNVVDVTRSETIILKKQSGQGHIGSISIKGSGNIDGKADVILMLNGAPYKVAAISGPVEFDWNGDWYSDEAEIRYSPVSVKAGKLTLSYKLQD